MCCQKSLTGFVTATQYSGETEFPAVWCPIYAGGDIQPKEFLWGRWNQITPPGKSRDLLLVFKVKDSPIKSDFADVSIQFVIP